MADSPDVRQYVDLTLFDRNAQEVFDVALIAAQYKLPGWVPREGNTEVVLLEAMALEVAELIFAANRVPGAVAEVLLRLFGLTRDAGAPATANVTFTMADSLGHEVPIGTTVRLTLIGATVDFTTAVGLAVPPGSSSGTVLATATANGTAAHAATIGTTLALVDTVTFVNTAVLATAPANGVDPEDADAFLTRGVGALSRLVTTLVLPSHFVSAALTHTYVFRATAVDNYDPAVGPSPGSNPGHVTVAVAGPAGGVVSAPNKALLLAELDAAAMANLAVHVVDPTITNVNVTTTVKGLAGVAAATVQANVTAVLTAYLNPDSWPWSGTVRFNELIARIDGAVGVDYVVSLTVPSADVALTGVAPLAKVGTVAVTVT